MDVSQVGRGSRCLTPVTEALAVGPWSVGQQRMGAGADRVHLGQPPCAASALALWGDGPSSSPSLPWPALPLGWSPALVAGRCQDASTRFSWILCRCRGCFSTKGHPPPFPPSEGSVRARLLLSSGISYSPWGVSGLTLQTAAPN